MGVVLLPGSLRPTRSEERAIRISACVGISIAATERDAY